MNKIIPLRTCIVTRNKREKKDLLRIVKTKDGLIQIDVDQNIDGRGVYITKSSSVIKKAIDKKILLRVLKIKELDKNIIDELLKI
jgi:predicted RNA-binding protein YlxR (DUF448 family)